MSEEDLRHWNITWKVIWCAMRVHSLIGSGFSEAIYERSLLVELENEGLRYSNQEEKDVYYKGILVGKRRLDVLVEEKVLLEIKAVAQLDSSCYNKIINYLKIYSCEVGLLLNFGTASLQFKRFVL